MVTVCRGCPVVNISLSVSQTKFSFNAFYVEAKGYVLQVVNAALLEQTDGEKSFSKPIFNVGFVRGVFRWDCVWLF